MVFDDSGLCMNIVLIGFMGSGKSAVGRALARRLEARLLDTDAEIERAAGKTIAEIFKQDGEEAFRAREAATLQSLIPERDRKAKALIIATGGGTPLRPENAALLKQIGPVVWLDASPETVLARVEKDLHERPLLASSEQDPAARIRALLAERAPRYAALADHQIATSNEGTSDDVAERILAALSGFPRIGG